MTIPTAPIMNLKDIFDHIKNDPEITVRDKTAICSALNRYSEITGVELSQITADPTEIRALNRKAAWQLSGIKKSTWANLQSFLRRAFTLVGIDVETKRRVGLSSAWAVLLDPLDHNQKHGLRRFAGFCSARNIEPADVTSTSFEAFLEYLRQQSFVWQIIERAQSARRAWNKYIAVAGSGLAPVTFVSSRPKFSRPWSVFPKSLQLQMDDWRQFLKQPDLEDDRQALRPVSITNYDSALRGLLSLLIDDGREIESFATINDIVDVTTMRRALALVQGNRTMGEAFSTLNGALSALRSLTTYLTYIADKGDTAAPVAGIELLKKISLNLRKQAGKKKGMTVKNRTRLTHLQNPTAGAMFQNLHNTVAARYSNEAKPTYQMAREMQMAAVHALLQEKPLRVKNVAELDLVKHIVRPAGGMPGTWSGTLIDDETKAHNQIEFEFSRETSALFNDYLTRFRPLLCKKPSTVLFVSRTGLAKVPVSLSRQYSAFIHRELGLFVNPHLCRSYAGMLWLDENPGQYTELSKILDHSCVKTTINSYTGLEAASALKRYHAIRAKGLVTSREFLKSAGGHTPKPNKNAAANKDVPLPDKYEDAGTATKAPPSSTTKSVSPAKVSCAADPVADDTNKIIFTKLARRAGGKA